MRITSDEASDKSTGAVRDEALRSLTVVINARPEAIELPLPEEVGKLALHPAVASLPHVQDVAIKQADSSLHVPARTFAALSEPW